MELLGIEMSIEEFDHLMCEQSSGKELKVVDGKVVAVEHEITKEECKQNRIFELKQLIQKYKEDVEQVELFGMERDDYEEKKQACRDIVLELRELESQLKNEVVEETEEELEKGVDNDGNENI